MTDRYSDYDTFAWVYNRHWGAFATRILPVLEKLVLGALPPKARILDLCCGTGAWRNSRTFSGTSTALYRAEAFSCSTSTRRTDTGRDGEDLTAMSKMTTPVSPEAVTCPMNESGRSRSPCSFAGETDGNALM